MRKTFRHENKTEEKAVAALAYGLVASHLAVYGKRIVLVCESRSLERWNVSLDRAFLHNNWEETND